MKKKFVCFLLVLLLFAAILPAAALAESDPPKKVLIVDGVDILNAPATDYPAGVTFDKDNYVLTLNNAQITQSAPQEDVNGDQCRAGLIVRNMCASNGASALTIVLEGNNNAINVPAPHSTERMAGILIERGDVTITGTGKLTVSTPGNCMFNYGIFLYDGQTSSVLHNSANLTLQPGTSNAGAGGLYGEKTELVNSGTITVNCEDKSDHVSGISAATLENKAGATLDVTVKGVGTGNSTYLEGVTAGSLENSGTIILDTSVYKAGPVLNVISMEDDLTNSGTITVTSAVTVTDTSSPLYGIGSMLGINNSGTLTASVPAGTDFPSVGLFTPGKIVNAAGAAIRTDGKVAVLAAGDDLAAGQKWLAGVSADTPDISLTEAVWKDSLMNLKSLYVGETIAQKAILGITPTPDPVDPDPVDPDPTPDPVPATGERRNGLLPWSAAVVLLSLAGLYISRKKARSIR